MILVGWGGGDIGNRKIYNDTRASEGVDKFFGGGGWGKQPKNLKRFKLVLSVI